LRNADINMAGSEDKSTNEEPFRQAIQGVEPLRAPAVTICKPADGGSGPIDVLLKSS